MLHELASDLRRASPTTSWRSSGTPTSSSPCSTGSCPRGSTTPGRASSSAWCGSGRSVPAGVQLGYHFCHGHEATTASGPTAPSPSSTSPTPCRSASAGRSTGSICRCRAGPSTCPSSRPWRSCRSAARPRLYLGLAPPVRRRAGGPGPDRRRPALRPRLRGGHRLRLGPPPSPGRGALIELHRAVTTPTRPLTLRPGASPGRPAGSACPTTTGPASRSMPSARPTTTSTTTAGTATSTPRSRSCPTCCDDGDILVDYSGGTGILLDRLKLRMFDTRAGAVIVDSSPKFLRVALEKFRDDPDVGLRLLRFLKPRAAARAARRGARSRAARAPGRRHRVDQRDPPLPRPGRHRRSRGCGPCGPAATC